MTYPEGGRGDTRAQYVQEVVDLVQKAIPEMGPDAQIKKIQFGHNPEGGSIWIARNSEAIIDPEVINVDGVDYYYGMFKSNKNETE